MLRFLHEAGVQADKKVVFLYYVAGILEGVLNRTPDEKLKGSLKELLEKFPKELLKESLKELLQKSPKNLLKVSLKERYP